MKTILLAVGILALAIIGFAVKILFKKEGSFSGTCAGNSEFLNNDGASCTVCGARPDERCKDESKT